MLSLASIGRQIRAIRRLALPACLAAAIGVFMALQAGPVSAAFELETPTYASGDVEAATGASPAAVLDDGGPWELGIHGTAGDLPAATAAERAGMSFWLAPRPNWVLRYSFNESTAWERDFKRAALGGTENNYIDAVDLQFYVGHGWPGGFTFANANFNDGSLVPNDCYRSWGTNDNEWLALTSCQVLATSNLSNWAACMNGQHLIMGFVTNASAYNNLFSTQAYHFGRYIHYNYSMPQAWYKACDVAQRGRITRTIINELACLNDKPNSGQVCADSYDWDWWYQTHACGTETAIYVPSQEITQLPVFQMSPYSLEEAAADFENLGDIFGIPVSTTVQMALAQQDASGFFTGTAGGLNIDMDKSSGIFNFSNLDELWTGEQAVRAMQVTAASPNFITQDDARTIADTFLRNSGLSGDGAVFYEVVSDTISSEIIIPEGASAATAASIMQDVEETPLVWQVIYSRRLNADVMSVAGTLVNHEFSVVGPGAKQKVYVPVAAEVGVANVLATAPVGVQGGWRSVGPVISAATGLAVMVDILTPQQAEDLYLALPSDVPLNDIPLDIKDREVLSNTIAYWEEAPGVSQGEMIPVYELLVRMTERQSDEVMDEYVYVPANEFYMRPIARIVEAPAVITAGDTFTLTAADASQTLRELGLADYDFAMGSGDYLYEWFIDGVAVEGDATLGGRVVTGVVAPFSSSGRVSALNLQLRVTDIASPNQSFSLANTTITSVPQVLLPTLFSTED